MNLDPDALKVLTDVIYYVVFNLTKAVLPFMQRDSFLYWPFVVSTVLAVWVLARWRGGEWGNFFSRKLWWHASARADYRLYFVNAMIFPAVFAPALISGASISGGLNALFGLTPAQAGPLDMTVLRVLYTLLFFVVYDLGRFVAHSLLHDLSVLWEFHKVHHSAQVLTPMTAYRVHPVELLLMAWVPALLTGLLAWVFNLAGAAVSFYSFLGLHVATWAFSLIDNLRHAPTWLSYGPRLGRWLVSPAHHQLHHSIEPRHWGCNRGSNLAIWDRLYGTLYVPGWQPETFTLGLGDQTEAQWNSVRHMYFVPFAQGLRRAGEALRPSRKAPAGRQ